MTNQAIITRLSQIMQASGVHNDGDTLTDIGLLIADLREELSNGITTARGRSLTHDHTLWHRPPHGTPFLLDWGTKEAMEAKLAEMVIEPPVKTEPSPSAPT